MSAEEDARAGAGGDRAKADRLAVGSAIGPYTLLTRIATGGMGHVWAARLNGVGGFSRVVALKVIRDDLAVDPDYVAMFVDEARVASTVHHPNVCEVFELGEEEGLLYFVMEWVRGDALSALLAASPTRRLEHRIAARITSDALAGLHGIHEAVDEDGSPLRAIHRDVSPQNVLVTAEGYVKVTDLGIAKAARQLHQPTEKGKVKGKIAYVAPEQLLQRPYDRRTDIFSVGCVLYEATVGAKPFGEGDVETMRNIVAGRYEKPSSMADYPSALAAIVEKSLAMEPDDRYRTAKEMQVALEAWLESVGQVASSGVADAVGRLVGLRIESRAQGIRTAASSLRGIPTERRAKAKAPPAAPAPANAVVANANDPTTPLRRSPSGKIAVVDADPTTPLKHLQKQRDEAAAQQPAPASAQAPAPTPAPAQAIEATEPDALSPTSSKAPRAARPTSKAVTPTKTPTPVSSPSKVSPSQAPTQTPSPTPTSAPMSPLTTALIVIAIVLTSALAFWLAKSL